LEEKSSQLFQEVETVCKDLKPSGGQGLEASMSAPCPETLRSQCTLVGGGDVLKLLDEEGKMDEFKVAVAAPREEEEEEEPKTSKLLYHDGMLMMPQTGKSNRETSPTASKVLYLTPPYLNRFRIIEPTPVKAAPRHEPQTKKKDDRTSSIATSTECIIPTERKVQHHEDGLESLLSVAMGPVVHPFTCSHKPKCKNICGDCGKCFSQSGNLTTHIRIVHQGLKPFKCPYCEKGFSVVTSLKNHVANIHEGRKDHICEVCSKAFSEKGSLKRHMNSVHHDVRYACPKCGPGHKGFSDRRYLGKHLRDVHGIRIEDIHGDGSLNATPLQTPGTPGAGQKFIREEGTGTIGVYQWSADASKWEKIGDVVDGPQGGADAGIVQGKKMFGGVEYDFVFDVDMDGMPLKLAYNKGDNPYMTAEKFVIENELDPGLLEQIVQYILQNTPADSAAPAKSVKNPFGQDLDAVSRNLGGPQHTSTNPYGYGGPTGALAQTGSGNSLLPSSFDATPVAAPTTNAHFPKTTYLTYRADAKIFPKIKGKLEALAGEIDADTEVMSDGPALREQDQGHLDSIFKTLSDPGHYHSTYFTDHEIGCLMHILKTWPKEKVFPVMDVVRSMAMHPDGGKRASSSAILDLMLACGAGTSPAANHGITMKYIANILSVQEGRTMLGVSAASLDKLLDFLTEFVSSGNVKLKVDLSSVLVNIAAMAFNGGTAFNETHAMQMMVMTNELMGTGEDVEVVYRALVATGTLAKGDVAGYRKLCSADAEGWVKLVTHHAATGQGKVLECAQGIEMIH